MASLESMSRAAKEPEFGVAHPSVPDIGRLAAVILDVLCPAALPDLSERLLGDGGRPDHTLSKRACWRSARCEGGADVVRAWANHCVQCAHREVKTSNITIEACPEHLRGPFGVDDLRCIAQIPPVPELVALKVPVAAD